MGPAYDEFRGQGGAPRPHQEQLAHFVEGRSPQDFEQLRQLVRRRINEQEVTFNILGVPEGTNRPWELDALPLVVSREEWSALARGLRQRARVLEAVLVDVYGPKRLLERGLLPAEVVFGSPRWLRPLHGRAVPRGARLLL